MVKFTTHINGLYLERIHLNYRVIRAYLDQGIYQIEFDLSPLNKDIVIARMTDIAYLPLTIRVPDDALYGDKTLQYQVILQNLLNQIYRKSLIVLPIPRTLSNKGNKFITYAIYTTNGPRSSSGSPLFISRSQLKYLNAWLSIDKFRNKKLYQSIANTSLDEIMEPSLQDPQSDIISDEDSLIDRPQGLMTLHHMVIVSEDSDLMSDFTSEMGLASYRPAIQAPIETITPTQSTFFEYDSDFPDMADLFESLSLLWPIKVSKTDEGVKVEPIKYITYDIDYWLRESLSRIIKGDIPLSEFYLKLSKSSVLSLLNFIYLSNSIDPNSRKVYINTPNDLGGLFYLETMTFNERIRLQSLFGKLTSQGVDLVENPINATPFAYRFESNGVTYSFGSNSDLDLVDLSLGLMTVTGKPETYIDSPIPRYYNNFLSLTGKQISYRTASKGRPIPLSEIAASM